MLKSNYFKHQEIDGYSNKISGFTLIEIMVAISLIALLVLFLVPSLVRILGINVITSDELKSNTILNDKMEEYRIVVTNNFDNFGKKSAPAGSNDYDLNQQQLVNKMEEIRLATETAIESATQINGTVAISCQRVNAFGELLANTCVEEDDRATASPLQYAPPIRRLTLNFTPDNATEKAANLSLTLDIYKPV